VRLGKFVVGPGLGLAIVASVGVFLWAPRPLDEPSNILAARERAKSPQTPPPLVKPEPQDLLARPLTPAQRDEIERIAEAWRVEREALEAEMQRHSSDLPKRPGSVEGLRTSLQGYSELSARYDRAREDAWRRALTVVEDLP